MPFVAKLPSGEYFQFMEPAVTKAGPSCWDTFDEFCILYVFIFLLSHCNLHNMAINNALMIIGNEREATFIHKKNIEAQ